MLNEALKRARPTTRPVFRGSVQHVWFVGERIIVTTLVYCRVVSVLIHSHNYAEIHEKAYMRLSYTN